MRVLIVEHDRALGLFLQKGLKLEGHTVDWVGDGDAAVEHATAHQPDLMVLALNLPRRDGMDVLAEMREHFGRTSVLILTARNNPEERIRCLDLGADDYVLKPFSFHELTARCRAILRRKSESADPILHCGEVEMNRLARSVSSSGVGIELSGREFTLLEYLLLHCGDCCTRAELLTNVWKMAPDSTTNVVDVYINYLRKKLAKSHPEDPFAASIIETVRGQGFRLHNAAAPGSKKPAGPVKAVLGIGMDDGLCAA